MFDYYNPQNTYIPRQQSFQMQQPQMGMQPPQMGVMQPVGLTRVTGIDGAKAFQMPPNSVAALFDGGEDIFYIKSTDGAGFPTIKAFSFTPIEARTTQAEFVTRQEFEELKGMIINGKQYIQRPAEPSERWTGTDGGYDYEHGPWTESAGPIKEPLFKRPPDS